MKYLIPLDLTPRLVYLKRVLPFIDKPIIKVFNGQRRVGKSYLLFQIMQYLLQQDKKVAILYINKEDLMFASIKTAQHLNDYVVLHKSKSKKTYVFIDEIQEITEFENALRSLLLDKTLDIYCTGSNANLLSKDVAGKLSGRCIEAVVYSLSYTEFLKFHQLKNTNDALENYLKYGGLPYLKNLKLNNVRLIYLFQHWL